MVLFFEGPAQGEKRKVEYKALGVWTFNKNKIAPGASSALLLPTAASPSAPGTDMFGSLTMMG